MPTYKLQNTETNEIWEEYMSISQMEEITKDPHVVQIYDSVNIVGGVKSLDSRTDAGWKENLSRIAEANPNSPLAERYGRKDIKKIKTNNVFDQHLKRQGK